MTASADYSIGITTRDRWSELANTLAQLGRFGLSGIETVVMDDGSSTPMPEELRTRFPWVQFERSASSLGYIAQRNRLAQRLTTPFYLSLDDDSYPFRGDLAAAVRWQAAHPEVIALAFRVWEGKGAPAEFASEAPFPVRFYIGCAHLLRREDFLRLGGYREELESYCEEFEFSVRAWTAGWTVMAWPEIVVRHDRTSSGRNLARINRLLTRNDLWIAMWHYPHLYVVLSILNCLPRQFRYPHHRTYWRSVLHGFCTAFLTLPKALRLQSRQALARHRAWRILPHPGMLVQRDD